MIINCQPCTWLETLLEKGSYKDFKATSQRAPVFKETDEGRRNTCGKEDDHDLDDHDHDLDDHDLDDHDSDDDPVQPAQLAPGKTEQDHHRGKFLSHLCIRLPE